MGILLSKHICNVFNYSIAIGKYLELNKVEIDELSIASTFHDIGKYRILKIINIPNKLTKEQFIKVKEHPIVGANIFRSLGVGKKIVDGILYHHEFFDGSGYPSGISGCAIPLYSRIISVADCFDAITSKRTYKNKMSREFAIKELINGRNTQFDPKIVDIFLDNKLYLIKNEFEVMSYVD